MDFEYIEGTYFDPNTPSNKDARLKLWAVDMVLKKIPLIRYKFPKMEDDAMETRRFLSDILAEVEVLQSEQPLSKNLKFADIQESTLLLIPKTKTPSEVSKEFGWCNNRIKGVRDLLVSLLGHNIN